MHAIPYRRQPGTFRRKRHTENRRRLPPPRKIFPHPRQANPRSGNDFMLRQRPFPARRRHLPPGRESLPCRREGPHFSTGRPPAPHERPRIQPAILHFSHLPAPGSPETATSAMRRPDAYPQEPPRQNEITGKKDRRKNEFPPAGRRQFLSPYICNCCQIALSLPRK